MQSMTYIAESINHTLSDTYGKIIVAHSLISLSNHGTPIEKMQNYVENSLFVMGGVGALLVGGLLGDMYIVNSNRRLNDSDPKKMSEGYAHFMGWVLGGGIGIFATLATVLIYHMEKGR